MMYQPVPHELILNSMRGRGSNCVEIAFNGVVSRIHIHCFMFSNLRTVVIVAFTGSEWERVVDHESFFSSKLIVITFDEFGGSVVGKVLDGFLPDPDIFVAAFGFLSIPAYFHEHKIRGDYHEIWLKAGGRNLYMCAKIHTDKRLKTEKNKYVLLVGEMHRLKDALDLAECDWMRFVLVSSDLTSEDPLFFNVFKVV